MSQEFICNGRGEVIGMLCSGGIGATGERIEVFDRFNNYKGWVDDAGTYDASGVLVSFSRMPGLLLDTDTDEDDFE